MPASREQQLIRAVEHAARTESPLAVELAYGMHTVDLTDEQVVAAIDRATVRDSESAALLRRLARELGPADAATARPSDGDVLPDWADLIGHAEVREVFQLTTHHQDLTALSLLCSYADGAWPHQVAFGVADVLGGIQNIGVAEFEDLDALKAEAESWRAVLTEHGLVAVEPDLDTLRSRLPKAFRAGFEIAWYDQALQESDWVVGAHRIRALTGVGVHTVEWPPQQETNELPERLARETGPRLEVGSTSEEDVVECLRWVFHFTTAYGKGDPWLIAPQSVQFLLRSALVGEGFAALAAAPRMPDVLRALIRYVAARDGWTPQRRDETLGEVDAMEPVYVVMCREDQDKVQHQRAAREPDLDFTDAAAVRRRAFLVWPDET